jgi:TRAP-type C4-dicarboxylate transport system substrate-binding protein
MPSVDLIHIDRRGETMRRMNQAVAVVAMTAVALSTCGCTQRTLTKAGGNSPPVTLRIGTDDDPGALAADEIEEFARQVQARSHGRISIVPAWQAAAGADVSQGWDQAVARRIMSGDLDMGMIPARAWESENVTSLRALQAPFLVTSDSVAGAVAAGDVADEMLAGLNRAGVTGLALVPEGARAVFSFGKPLMSRSDFADVTVRVPRSETAYALFRALGAHPDDFAAPGNPDKAATLAGRIGAYETSYDRGPSLPKASTAAGNATLYYKMNAVVVNNAKYASLDKAQRAVLQDAAVATRDWATSSAVTTARWAQKFCDHGGTVVLATPSDLAGLQQAARSVYVTLERDSQTASLISRIRGLAARTAASPPVRACSPRPAPTAAAPAATGSFPDGVYRKNVSAQEILAGGASGRDARSHEGQWTMAFDKGALTIEQRGWPIGPGVYCVSAGRVTAAQGRARCDDAGGIVVFTAAWRLDGDQLFLFPTAVGKQEPPGALTNTLFGGAPWTKIG